MNSFRQLTSGYALRGNNAVLKASVADGYEECSSSQRLGYTDSRIWCCSIFQGFIPTKYHKASTTPQASGYPAARNNVNGLSKVTAWLSPPPVDAVGLLNLLRRHSEHRWPDGSIHEISTHSRRPRLSCDVYSVHCHRTPAARILERSIPQIVSSRL